MKIILKGIRKFLKACWYTSNGIVYLTGACTLAGVLLFVDFKAPEQLPSEMATDQVQKVYNKLRMATDQVAKVPPIYMLAGPYSYMSINAFTNGHGIWITHGLANALSNNEDALALIIGHEIAHTLLHHTNKLNILIRDSGPADETLADGYGAFLAAKAGYNICKGAEFFAAMRKHFGDNLDSSHPPHIYRLHHLKMKKCTI